MKKGIDVSYAQGEIDWTKVETDFAIIKCNTGVKAPDAFLQKNAIGASKKGIPIGYYHWATLKTFDVVADAKEEAAEFIDYLKKLPKYDPRIPPVLDFEEENKLKFSPEMMQLWVLTFYSELKKAGHGMMLYGYAPYFNANFPKNHVLGHIPLWLAGYPWDVVGRPTDQFAQIPENVGVPKFIPNGWKVEDVKIWQYSGQGHVPSVSKHHVDLNIMYGD
jgi:lysozyme